jgi:hypothetical protein
MAEPNTPLPLTASRSEQIFPTLSSAQIARVAKHGRTRTVRSGEVLVEQGEQAIPFFVVISGELAVVRPLTLSTPHRALKNLAKGPLTRPNNFMMLPQICTFGYPHDVDPNKCTLITPFSSERSEWMNSKCVNVRDSRSPVYKLTDEYDGRRMLTKNFFMLLDSYQNHPEAKSLGPDGKPGEFDTRGLLQRAHIVANWPPIYFGKESDRHWEEGDDPSLVDFKCIQYRRKGYAVATDEQLAQIAKVHKTGIHAPGNQSAHAGKDMQQGTGARGQTSEMLEYPRRDRRSEARVGVIPFSARYPRKDGGAPLRGRRLRWAELVASAAGLLGEWRRGRCVGRRGRAWL